MNQQRHYSSVDGLKGLLIFIIVLHNLIPVLPSTEILDTIPLTSFISIYGGSLGDSLFFVLSGFLIATGYKERIKERSIPFPIFLWKRICKLYPMHILSNLVMLIMTILKYGLSGINLNRIISTALIQLAGGLPHHPYNGPSGFLSYLFLCYMLYFAISYFTAHATSYCLSLFACLCIGYALMGLELPVAILSSTTGWAVMNFALGCILVELLPCIRKKNFKWLPAASFLVVAASLYLMMRYGVEVIAGNSKVVFTFLVAPVCLYLAMDGKWCRCLLESKPIQFLGKISMGVFFWHYPVFTVMQYLFSLFGATLTELYFPLYLLILILFCTLYRYFTKPALWQRA